MTTTEARIRQALLTELPPPADPHALLAVARRRGRAIRRRRRAAAALAVVAGVTGASVAATSFVSDNPAHRQTVLDGRDTLPHPAGPVVTVYRFVQQGGAARVVSFLDTEGRWCLATWTRLPARDPARYQCVPDGLGATTHGFGRVNSRDDGGMYDGRSTWQQGVVSNDVARVVIAMTDGTSQRAHVVAAGSGRVFYAAVPWLHEPRWYRAYDAHGRLMQQIPVPHVLPHDPLTDSAP
ncbi:MAG TPA: hypothetical protein VFJ98_05715 [Mycobacteriales bacterium]|nr:hypothetical protein [Mycobacteriales bacterium]